MHTIAALSLPYVAVGALSCEPEWESFMGKCYLFNEERVVKPVAKHACYEMDAVIALVTNEQENDFLSARPRIQTEK